MPNTLNIAYIVIVGLAAARFTSLIVFDSIMEPIRHRLFLLSPPNDDIDLGYVYQHTTRKGAHSMIQRRAGFFGRLLSCYHCAGVWVSICVYAALQLSEEWSLPVIVVAAIAQVSDTIIKVTR